MFQSRTWSNGACGQDASCSANVLLLFPHTREQRLNREASLRSALFPLSLICSTQEKFLLWAGKVCQQSKGLQGFQTHLAVRN